jgi:hypothetical protein
MVLGKFPASTILVDAQFMSGREMPSEHLAAPAALQADYIVAMDGSPNRHGRRPPSLGFGCQFSETGERLMDGRDERPELVRSDLVSPNVPGDDVGREFSIK